MTTTGQPVEIVPYHVLRAGHGLDAWRLTAHGPGLLWGALGRHVVRGTWERVVMLRPGVKPPTVWWLGRGGLRRVVVPVTPQLEVRMPAVANATPRLPRAQVNVLSPPPGPRVPVPPVCVEVRVPSMDGGTR